MSSLYCLLLHAVHKYIYRDIPAYAFPGVLSYLNRDAQGCFNITDFVDSFGETFHLFSLFHWRSSPVSLAAR